MLQLIRKLKLYFEIFRYKKKIAWLEENGLTIGKNVFLPMTTWIDASHCYLISIGDNCRFGPNCSILSHDASMNELVDAGKVGLVIIHDSCFIGFGSIILPGVEIGPNSIVGAYTVVSKTVPPGVVVAGNPAKIVGTVDDFKESHLSSIQQSPNFDHKSYGSHILSEEKREIMIDELRRTSDLKGYIVGGYSSLNESDEYELISGRQFDLQNK